LIELSDEAEALVWAAAGAPVLQLERFSPDQVRALKDRLTVQDRAPIIAVAGGVHSGNAVACATAGAGRLVSSASYYAGPKAVKVACSRVD
jgi:molybdenum transport protein